MRKLAGPPDTWSGGYPTKGRTNLVSHNIHQMAKSDHR